MDKEIPPVVPGVASLLGAGKQSLLRTNAPDTSNTRLENYAVRINQAILDDPPCRVTNHNFGEFKN